MNRQQQQALSVAIQQLWNAMSDHYEGLDEARKRAHAHPKEYWKQRFQLTHVNMLDNAVAEFFRGHVDDALNAADEYSHFDTILANARRTARRALGID